MARPFPFSCQTHTKLPCLSLKLAQICCGISPRLPQRHPRARPRAAIRGTSPGCLTPKADAATVKNNIGITVHCIDREIQAGRGIGVHTEGEVEPAWHGIEIGEAQRRLLTPTLPIGPVQRPVFQRDVRQRRRSRLPKAADTQTQNQQTLPPPAKVFHFVAFPRLPEFTIPLPTVLPDSSAAPI